MATGVFKKGGVKKTPRRKYGRTDDHERKAVPIFDDDTRRELDGNVRFGFVDAIIHNFDKNKVKPEDIVDEARVYFRKLYEEDLRRNLERPSHWLNSASTALTKVKSRLKSSRLAPYDFRREVALSRRELVQLDTINHRRLEQKIHAQPEVDLSKLLSVLFALLRSEDPAEVAIGISGLTGRRQTEVVHSMVLAEPSHKHRHRYPSYWAHVTGFSKGRQHDRYAVRARELPLLAPRVMLVEAIREVRDHWPSDSHSEASALYGNRLAAAAKKHLRSLGIKRMHDLRKTFIQIAYAYFNERESVLPAFASSVLGHKSELSNRIMTYLIIRTKNMLPLQEIFNHGRMSHLRIEKAEYHEELLEPETRARPMYDTPDEEEDVGIKIPDSSNARAEAEAPANIEVDPRGTHERSQPPASPDRDVKYHFDKRGRALRRSAADIALAVQNLEL
jgi:Telomere resolvase